MRKFKLHANGTQSNHTAQSCPTWANRQPGVLASPSASKPRDHHARESPKATRKRKFDNISSPQPQACQEANTEIHSLYLSPSQQEEQRRKKRKVNSLFKPQPAETDNSNSPKTNKKICIGYDNIEDAGHAQTNYFDDDLDDALMLKVLHTIKDTNPGQQHTVDDMLCTQPAMDFSPKSKRQINSPLSQPPPPQPRPLPAENTQTNNHNIQNASDETTINRYYRFEVTEICVDQATRSKILKVKDIRTSSTQSECEWIVELRQDWFESMVSEHDIMHVIGETVHEMRDLFIRRQQKQSSADITFPSYLMPNENVPMIIDAEFDIVVDNLHNYVVIHPDCLVIPSRIASSFNCPRKEVIAHNLRQFTTTPVLLYGTMAHELFQETLQRGTFDAVDVQQDMNMIISKHLLDLYSINQTELMAKQTLSEFVPNILEFFGKYVPQQQPQQQKLRTRTGEDKNVVDWGSCKQQLQITKVMDIEEDIWSPMFGICGSIDATLQIRTQPYVPALQRQRQRQRQPRNGASRNNVSGDSECLYKLLPFELKTGKESLQSVLQARAQLALYSLMLADRYDTSTNGGLLFYLKTGHLMGVPLPHNEIRALLIRRNFLAKYFNSHPTIDVVDDSENVDLNNTLHTPKVQVQQRKQKEFPSMLSVHETRLCKNCFSKQECFIYHKVQCYNSNVDDVSDANITSNSIYSESVSHVSEQHLQYLNQWIELIDLEETHCLGTRHEIWAMSSTQRESKAGRCLANMVIAEYAKEEFKHVYTFIKHPDYYERGAGTAAANGGGKYSRNKSPSKDIIKLWDLKFRVNDRIVIGTEDGKYGLSKGSLIELTTKYVKYASYKPIKDLSHFIMCGSQVNDNRIRYRLDIDDAAYSYSSLRANVFYYFYAAAAVPQVTTGDEPLDDVQRSQMEIDTIRQRKRELLVDLMPPQFDGESDATTTSMIPAHLQSAFDALNIDQQNAVRHVMKCKDYALILGMPGTGKSATIVFLLRLLCHCGYKIVLSAYTNSAVDHLCLKLVQFADVRAKFVRVGSILSINSKLTPYCLDMSNKQRFDTVSSIDAYIQQKNIFAVTSTSASSHSIFTSKCNIFDYCIIDEAGQLTEPQVLGPLKKCRKFVLVGDNNQLPPLVQCREAERKGMSISVFEKLATKYGESAVQSLTIQYRMNEDILRLSNELIYNGRMKCASPQVAQQKITLSKNMQTISMGLQPNEKWLAHALNPDLNVVVLDTDKLYESDNEENGNKNKKNNVNEHEADMIERMVHKMFECGVYSSQIGIMAPYRSQLKLIKNKLDKLNVPLSPSSQILLQRDHDDDEPKAKKAQSSLLLDTIDRFQGSDRDIIIMSFTHTPFDKKVGKILHDWRRINVALTRAKCKLILIASIKALKHSNSNILCKIVNVAQKQNWIYQIE